MSDTGTNNDTAPADDAAGNAADETGADAAKRRFREALDRKKAAAEERPAAPGSTGSHLKGSNAKTQRQFRRKSG